MHVERTDLVWGIKDLKGRARVCSLKGIEE